MDEARTHRGPGRPRGRVLLVLHDALHRHAPLNMTIGDVVLTDHAFCFLRYHDFQFSGSLAEGGAFLLAGAAGAMAVSIGDRDSLRTAREIASGMRSRLFGFPLEDRVTRHPDSSVHSSERIERLSVSGEAELSVVLRNGERLSFFVPAMSAELRAAVGAWPETGGRYDRADDPDGFFAGSASPRVLLDLARNGDSNAASELHELGRKPAYAITLYSELHARKADERRVLLELLAHAPPGFRESLAAVAEEESIRGLGKVISGSLAIPVFGLLLGGVAITWNSILAGLAAALMILLSGAWVAIGVGELRRARETRKFLV